MASKPRLTAPRHRIAAKGALRLVTSILPVARMQPWFLVIGVKRGGSTSLHEYLLQHPDVLPPHVTKGSRYFDVNFHRGRAWFHSHFPTAAEARRHERKTGRTPMTGESSPYYFFHPLSPERIARELPEVRLLLALRDPVERAWSHFNYELTRGFEDLDIVSALDAEKERLSGEAERMRADPRYVSLHHRHHAYLARGRYAEQLRALYLQVSPERVLVISSEQMFADTALTMRRVTDFLGLAPYTPERTRAFNANDYSAMTPEIRERLNSYYAPHNEDLFALLGERFPWSTGEPGN